MFNQFKLSKKLFQKSTVLFSVILLIALSFSDYSNSQTVTINSMKDNTLYEDASGLSSNGAGQYFFTGATAFGGLRRGVIAFDIAGNIPQCATITSVSLTLHMSKTISGGTDVELIKLLEDWGEGTSAPGGQEGFGAPSEPGDATWIHNYYSGVFWDNGNTVGGVYSGTVSAVTSVSAENLFYTWGSTSEMTADVQQWLNNPSGNFGWIIIGDERNAATAKRFDTKENSDSTFHPKLTVTYTMNNPALNLTSFIEGFWDGTSMVNDTARVYLASSISPYPVVDSAIAVLNSNGNAVFCFSNAPAGTYYIVVNHRNSIETWSKLPQTFTAGVMKIYDFSDGDTKAYGDNEVFKSGKYCIYGGDVNKDGIVDASDVSDVENDASNSLSGYVQTDVTGDDFVDSSDISLIENNSSNSVTLLKP
jgi:hypothetical protein